MPTTRTTSLLLALALMGAACTSGDSVTDDPTADCRSAFGEGPVACGPGTDITSIQVDGAGPIVLTVELSEAPQYDNDFQWLVEFSISDLACGLTNTEFTDDGTVGSDVVGPYGYRILTNEDAPPGTCQGSLNEKTAVITFNILPPAGPWTVDGGTQHIEIENLDDDGSSDDVVIEMTPSG